MTALVLGALSVGFIPAPLGRQTAAVALTESEPGHRLVEPQARGRISLAEVAEAGPTPTPGNGRSVPSPPIPTTNPVPAGAQRGGGAAPVASIPIGPLAPSPATSLSFEAVADNNRGIPPDTNGAVGPNHLIVTLNTEFAVQDRNGVELLKLSIGAFWAGAFTTVVFDPRVVYDQAADRWVVVTVADYRVASSAVLVAVSDTGDPRGTWTRYSFDADGPNLVWADFPIVGLNDQWVVITLNMYANADDAFARSDTYVMDRLALYDGTLTIADVFTEAGSSSAPMISNDANVDIMYLADSWSSASGLLRVSSITGPVGAPVYNAGIGFPSAVPWDFRGPDAPQLGSTDLIDIGDARIGQPCTYRDGSLWCTHHVFLPAGAPTHSSIQWWELDPQTSTVVQFGRIDDPSGDTFYAYPSIAVNKYDDVLIGYSRFSADQYASANYAFRYGSDPAGTLNDDTVLKAGEASYYKIFGGRRGTVGATTAQPWSIR